MPDSPATSVDIGLTVPDSFGLDDLSPDDILSRAAGLGIRTIELAAPVVEGSLGAPVEPALLNPPEDSFETGLLPIEEEVFQDELELARATFNASVREWRRSVSREDLTAYRQPFDEAGVRIGVLRWQDLSVLTDLEVDYGLAMARTLGATAVVTELTSAGPARLAGFAQRHQVVIGFVNDDRTRPDRLATALAHGPFNGVAIDLGAWAAGRHGSPLPFLAQHAGRVTHVRLSARGADDATASFGAGEATTRLVLRGMRDHRWSFPAIVAFESDLPDGSTRMAAIASAVAYCRENT